MRQFDTLRKRYEDQRSRWFQVGLASATLLTPLLKRWNDLRAAEQARAWRDEAEARLREVRRWNPIQRNNARRQAQEAIEQVAAPRGAVGNVSATIWLAGVGVGLLAAGTGAYFLVRRRMRLEREEPLLDLPIPLNGNGAHLRETARAMAQEISRSDEQAASAARNSVVPTSTATPASPQSSMPAPAQAGPLMPSASASATETASATAAQASEPGGLSGAALASATEASNANDAAFVGNIHTMVYHAADADDLPTEENRIYFASEDEAHERGYRRARDGVSSDK